MNANAPLFYLLFLLTASLSLAVGLRGLLRWRWWTIAATLLLALPLLILLGRAVPPLRLPLLFLAVLGPVICLAAAQNRTTPPLRRRIRLHPADPARPTALPLADRLLGASGETITALRPVGTALLNGRRQEVLSADGSWLAAGTPVRVTAIQNRRILVAETKENP